MNKISVIIVSFNNENTIQNCLESVLENKIEKEIIVVDNNSEDETEKILKKYKGISLIFNETNLGFSKANNIAAKKAIAEYLLFLNPDAKLMDQNCLEKLVDLLDNNPDYGLIGPKLILPDGKVQKSVRNLPTVWRALQEYIFGIKNSFDFYVPESENLLQVESVVGACVIIKKEVFEKVGLFDEKYFLYFEDLQLCKDLQSMGLKIGYAPNIIVEHAHGISGAGKNTNLLSIESAKKYHGRLNFFLIQIIGRLGNKVRRNF